MRFPSRKSAGALLGCIGASILVARCLVFDGRTAQRDEAIDSAVGDSAPATSPESDTTIAPDPGIRCGANDWCPLNTVCCLKLGSSGWFAPSTECNAPGTCDNFSEFACDTARECGDGSTPTGQSCCATRESTATEFQGSSCIPTGACMPASLAVMLCTPGERDPCPTHQACVSADAAELPPGYYACQ
jgi:hypothetical protein